jgi:DASH complex subunit SPC19
VETYLDKLERREQALMAKCELQEGRLGGDSSGSRLSKSVFGRPDTSAAAGSVGTVSTLKMNQARLKKERLSYAIDRLQMQAQQKERQLRKSLAAPPVIDDDDGF